MPSATLQTFPLRIKFNVDSRTAQAMSSDANAPALWRGNDVSVAVAVYRGGVPLDLSNVVSMKLQIKDRQNPFSSTPLAESSISYAAGDITALIQDSAWQAGSVQNGVFAFSSGQTNLDLSGANFKQYWLVLSGVTNTGAIITYGAAFLTVFEDNAGTDGTPPAVPGASFYTAAQMDALLASRMLRWLPGVTQVSGTGGNPAALTGVPTNGQDNVVVFPAGAVGGALGSLRFFREQARGALTIDNISVVQPSDYSLTTNDRVFVDIFSTLDVRLQVLTGSGTTLDAITPGDGELAVEIGADADGVAYGIVRYGNAGAWNSQGMIRYGVSAGNPAAVITTPFISASYDVLQQSGVAVPTVFGKSRGFGAIDLSLTRSNPKAVASGFASQVLGGVNNTAAGNFSSAKGCGARALGYFAESSSFGVALGEGSFASLGIAFGQGAIARSARAVSTFGVDSGLAMIVPESAFAGPKMSRADRTSTDHSAPYKVFISAVSGTGPYTLTLGGAFTITPSQLYASGDVVLIASADGLHFAWGTYNTINDGAPSLTININSDPGVGVPIDEQAFSIANFVGGFVFNTAGLTNSDWSGGAVDNGAFYQHHSRVECLFEKQTTNATASQMTAASDSYVAQNTLRLAPGDSYLFTIDVIVRQTSGTGSGSVLAFTRRGLISRDTSGTTTISAIEAIGSSRSVGTPDAWDTIDATLAAANYFQPVVGSYNDLKFALKGTASKTLRWFGHLKAERLFAR